MDEEERTYRVKQKTKVAMPAWLPFIWIFLIIFIVGFLIGIPNALNLSWKHTYDETCTPGVLVSDRYDKFWITMCVKMILEVIYFIITIVRVIKYKDSLAFMIHFITFLAWLAIAVAFAVIWGLELKDCNDGDAEGNRCNSYKWCGVYAENSTYCPKNYCGMNDTLSACDVNATVTNWTAPVTSSGIEENDDWRWAFYLSLIMIALGFIIGLLSWFTRKPIIVENDVMRISDKMPQVESYVGGQDRFEPSEVDYVPLDSVITGKPHRQ